MKINLVKLLLSLAVIVVSILTLAHLIAIPLGVRLALGGLGLLCLFSGALELKEKHKGMGIIMLLLGAAALVLIFVVRY